MSTDSTSWTVDTSGVTADSGDYTADGSNYILFPSVPALPGVPALNRISPGVQQIVDTVTGAAVSTVTQSLLTGMSLQLAPGPLPQYAFLNSSNGAALTPDSVLEVDVQAPSDMMTHPVEEGQFEAYNRAQDSIVIRLLLGVTGQGETERSTFLSTLESMREGTEVITLVTPDAPYPNMALKDYGYKKTAERGAVTLWADTTWEESRSTGVTVSSTPTAQPQGAATTSLGTLQPQTPSAQQSASIANPPVVPAALPAAVSNESPPSGDAF